MPDCPIYTHGNLCIDLTQIAAIDASSDLAMRFCLTNGFEVQLVFNDCHDRNEVYDDVVDRFRRIRRQALTESRGER